MSCKLSLVAILLSSLAACSDSRAAASAKRVADSSAGTVALGIGGSRAYRPAPIVAAAVLAGSVRADTAPRDSVVGVTVDAGVCGDSAVVSPVNGSAGGLGGALIWVEAPTTGKPLPDMRRETITIERCQFSPRVTAVVSRSTINVFTRDRVVHDIRFYREGAGEPVEHIHTVDAGQVVPSEKIASAPGVVEARCTRHPWVRAYVAVFAHPYFAVTDANGAFRIDSLPPGTYTVKIWHDRLEKPVEQRVVVGPSGAGRLDVAVALN